jgi:hypothetical protein
MNRESTIVSVSLVATGVATFIFLGNPEMDNYYPMAQASQEKSLLRLGPSDVYENTDKKLAALESEVADLRRQMASLSEQLAGNVPHDAHLREPSESIKGTFIHRVGDREYAKHKESMAIPSENPARESVDKGWVEEIMNSIEALMGTNADLAGA